MVPTYNFYMARLPRGLDFSPIFITWVGSSVGRTSVQRVELKLDLQTYGKALRYKMYPWADLPGVKAKPR